MKSKIMMLVLIIFSSMIIHASCEVIITGKIIKTGFLSGGYFLETTNGEIQVTPREYREYDIGDVYYPRSQSESVLDSVDAISGLVAMVAGVSIATWIANIIFGRRN